MSEIKKKITSIFKSRNSSQPEPEPSPPPTRERRKHRHRSRRDQDREGDSNSPKRHHTPRTNTSHSPESRPRTGGSSKHREEHTAAAPQPLEEWPPVGYTLDDDLSQGKAMELIATGVPVFKGIVKSIPHASDDYFALYTTCDGNGRAGSDRAYAFKEAFTVDSLRMQGPGEARRPWETLERPSMAYCYGMGPGTITLNHWASLAGNSHPMIELRDSGILPREVNMIVIIDRLKHLLHFEGLGVEEDDVDLRYKNLYKVFLKDPDKLLNPHKGMEKQIADLITVLSRHEWIDFSKPQNHIIAKFFAPPKVTPEKQRLFFLQLLLSIELDIRINSKSHSENAKKRVLEQLPPWIAWDIALARKWRECARITSEKASADDANVREVFYSFGQRAAQIKALRKFARAMKWPNLIGADEALREVDPEAIRIDDRSSDAMSYFSGLILPGPTLPWLIMNTLIDCDDDPDALDLVGLTHMHPNTGFQYKNSTYWSSTCIIGKVIAPTCQEIAGWVGPAMSSPDMDRTQVIRTHQKRCRQRVLKTDVESMRKRSDPLGPPANSYPVSEYALPDPDVNKILDTARIEKLAIKPHEAENSSPSRRDSDGPELCRASLIFAISGRSWPLQLSHDVFFISSYPCSNGPHPLFTDYIYRLVRADKALDIQDWGSFNPPDDGKPKTKEELDRAEEVLVIDAVGVKDNEVLARAWCAHWGLSAVVCDRKRTCLACAIREAYAGALVVVVMMDSGWDGQ